MNWALLAASLGLVVATLGLVVFTWRLADEAAKTRAEMVEAHSPSVRPRLTFDLMVLGGKVGMLLIRKRRERSRTERQPRPHLRRR